MLCFIVFFPFILIANLAKQPPQDTLIDKQCVPSTGYVKQCESISNATPKRKQPSSRFLIIISRVPLLVLICNSLTFINHNGVLKMLHLCVLNFCAPVKVRHSWVGTLFRIRKFTFSIDKYVFLKDKGNQVLRLL